MSFEPAILGSTGLKVGRLGLSAADGARARAVEEAFEGGADYFHWRALRRGMMVEGIRRLAQKNRDKIIIGLQNHWPWAKLIPKSLKASSWGITIRLRRRSPFQHPQVKTRSKR